MNDTPHESTARWERVVGDVRGEPGPVLLCIGGVHGNEPAGLIAGQRVVEKLFTANAEGKEALRGRVLVVAGNLAALHTGDPTRRYFASDLNRMFDAATIDDARRAPAADRTPEQVELLELLALLESVGRGAPPGSAVLDLHTVSSASPAFAFTEDSLPARRMGLALGLPLVVGLEEELSGLMVDYVSAALGLVSLVVEAGTHDDPGSVEVHEAAIWVTMQTRGMIESADALAGFDTRARLRAAAGSYAGHFYDVRQRVPVGEPPLEILDRARAFTRVWKGLTPIATRGTDRRGDVVRAPADGLLFMPNRQQRKAPTDDAFFVLRPVWRRFIGFSGWLRQQRWPHRLLAALPGVSRDKGDPHTLRVDHDVAALMARDVMHLFGYRVHSAGHAAYHRPLTRLLMVFWVVPRALLRVAGVLPTECDEIWIVRRHLLDVEAGDDRASIAPANAT
jgi:predicted deacylase